MKKSARRGLTALGALAFVGSLVAGAYYFLVSRGRKPQVELYFDDGSMIALPAEAAEAQPFVTTAAEVLKANPLGS